MKKDINMGMCELSDDDAEQVIGGASAPKLNSYILNLIRSDSKYDSPELKASSPEELEKIIKKDSERLIKEVLKNG